MAKTNRFSLWVMMLLGLSIYMVDLGAGYFHLLSETANQVDFCEGEEETDLCHISVYHADQATGCDHPTHIQPHKHHCDLCEALFKNLHETVNQGKDITFISFPEYQPVINEQLVAHRILIAHRLRGPPTSC